MKTIADWFSKGGYLQDFIVSTLIILCIFLISHIAASFILWSFLWIKWWSIRLSFALSVVFGLCFMLRDKSKDPK